MKKFFLVLIVAALTLAVAAPALAGLKLTSKGRMDVTSIYMSGNAYNRFWVEDDRHKSGKKVGYFQQELVIDPTLHVNEKVKIHGRFTIMERTWAGGDGDDWDANMQGSGANFNYRGAHNFWVERLWMSFPLFGGTLRVGRMPGGSWAFPWQNWDWNRDRILYLRSFGPIVLIGVYEKNFEGDDTVLFPGSRNQGRVQSPQSRGPLLEGPFDQGHSDWDSYALGAVVPFSRNIIWRPLLYYRNWEWFPTNPKAHGYLFLTSQALMVKAGIFKMDLEVNWWNVCVTKYVYDGDEWHDWQANQFAAWGEAGVHPGPFSIIFGAFYLQGARKDADIYPWHNRSISATGGEFQPTLLLWSEDMGLVWNSTGVNNGTTGASGWLGIYLRGAYKINDTMTLTGIIHQLWTDTMYSGTKMDNTGARVYTRSQNYGMEANVGFEWKFMDNLKYVFELAYLWSGPAIDGWNDVPSNNVLGMRNMLVIEW
ncbi:MAG: hypothetical protein GY849_16490 [Deltaproteobacteria bacterium]|nr:hypothetical protein [Deltaproteobacteria bacterium]